MKTYPGILGDMEIDENAIVNFRDGLLGLEDFKKYALLALPGNDRFFCLQSLENEKLAFFAIRPWDFFPDYEADIPDEEMAEVGIMKADQAAVYALLTVSGETKDMTANLLAPIVIGGEMREGKQVVLRDGAYGTKHRLFAEKGV